MTGNMFFLRRRFKAPLITLSVPVYGTESSLPSFFDSVLEQTVFDGTSAVFPLEIIVVNDASPTGALLHKIIRRYKKDFAKRGCSLVVEEHRKNLGTLEARRTCVLSASAPYTFFADPDDTLAPCAIETLYNAARSSGADIVHGRIELFVKDPALHSGANTAAFAQVSERVRRVHEGFLEGKAVQDDFFLAEGHTSFLCAKLFRTEPLCKAYEAIPHTFCTMAEDLLVYFFVLQQNPSYFGINDTVYRYNNDAGITSKSRISDLARWEKACSASSVFTVIFEYLQTHPIDEQYEAALRELCGSYLMSNLGQLKACVEPSLQEEAYKILCDYWGESLVKRAEEAVRGRRRFIRTGRAVTEKNIDFN